MEVFWWSGGDAARRAWLTMERDPVQPAMVVPGAVSCFMLKQAIEVMKKSQYQRRGEGRHARLFAE